MLKSIQIVNFQSHRNSILRLSPGVNVIVGDPQNGKTAILRALELLRTNRPSGFRYHSHFADGPATMVNVEVPEGSIAFSKTESGAFYSIGETTFQKIGTAVPDKVTELLNLQDLNIQGQLDPHFLIADSPADIAREINRITNIDLIDKWTSALNRKKHTTSVMIGQATRKVEGLSGKLKSLDGLEEIEPILKEAERKQREADGKKIDWNRLRLLSDELEDAELSIAMLEKVATTESFIVKAEKNIEQVQEKRHLVDLINQFCDGETRIDGLTKSIQSVDEVVQKVESGIKRYEDIYLQLMKLKSFIQLDEEVSQTEEEMEGIKRDYIALVEKLGKCPFCLTKLTKESMSHVLEHL